MRYYMQGVLYAGGTIYRRYDIQEVQYIYRIYYIQEVLYT